MCIRDRLPVEEREAGLTPEKGASIEDRRAALAAKWRSLSGKCDIELIRTICGLSLIHI